MMAKQKKQKAKASFESIVKQFPAFSIEFNGESDRGVCLITAGYIDDLLEDLLRNIFVDRKQVVDKLFEGQGGLATFSSRTSLAYCLGLIRQDQFDDIQTIREIRNMFAHWHEPLGFDKPPIAQLCDKLKQLTLAPEKQRELSPGEFRSIFGRFKTRREKFIGTTLHLVTGISVRSETITHCTVGIPCGSNADTD